MEPVEVLCIGETMALLAPLDGPLTEAERLRLDIGGAESTVALYLREFGQRTAWLSRVGDDPFGERIVRTLSGHGVDTRFVRTDTEAPTGVYFKNPGIEKTTVHYYRAGSAASRMGEGELDGVPLDELRLVHLSGITPALSASCRALVEQVLALPKREGREVCFDVNYRPALWPVAEAAPVLRELAARADVVFVGQDEAQTLWGLDTPEEVRELIPGPRRLVIKDGAIGASEFEGTRKTFVSARPVEVVEVVGAGDAFASGYLAGLLAGHEPAQRLAEGHELAARTLRSTDDFVPVTRAART
ncbi:sugar kinase [Sciscionella marina]|uniref:sugar kinase n=1 Tax=Sciscionella marina TaxID=508770 RepID=UPI00035D96F0|nr:sugar kinase [Sciscionella marina]